MGVDAKSLQEKFNRKGSQRADRMKLDDGDNYLRLLPPTLEYLAESVDYISIDYLMHYRIGYEGNYSHEVCPKTTNKQNKCPVCEAVNKLYATKDETDRQLAGRIRAKIRYTFNVIDLNNLDKGVQILEQGSQIYTEILKFISNPKYSDILDLDKGRNVTITKIPEKESNTGFVKYEFIPDPDVCSTRDKLPKNWKEQVAKLEAAVETPKSYVELKKILEGVTDEDEPEVKEEVVVEETIETPATETVVEAPKGEKPECFGEEFGPKKEQCTACDVKVDCREEYLKID
jgi:hypothetical protein